MCKSSGGGGGAVGVRAVSGVALVICYVRPVCACACVRECARASVARRVFHSLARAVRRYYSVAAATPPIASNRFSPPPPSSSLPVVAAVAYTPTAAPVRASQRFAHRPVDGNPGHGPVLSEPCTGHPNARARPPDTQPQTVAMQTISVSDCLQDSPKFRLVTTLHCPTLTARPGLFAPRPIAQTVPSCMLVRYPSGCYPLTESPIASGPRVFATL